MLRFALLLALLTGTCGLLLATSTDADACAAVPRLNEPSITIAQESAIIVWNPAKKVQHFIRRAAFDTKSPDFGFLVPTPTMPQVPFPEIEDGIFNTVDTWLLPKIVEQTRWKFDPFISSFFRMGSRIAPGMHVGDKDSVRILHEQKVGGFETVVIEADKTEDLSNWLTKNGYSNDPELQSWLVPYVGAKWKITAFKIMQDPKTGGLASTKAVRMSFAAERPFFPYREPEGKPEKKEPDPDKSKQKIQYVPTEVDGIWIVDSVQGEGAEASKLQGTKFHFVEGVVAGRYLKDSKYKVDASGEPKTLDVGKTPGIYKTDGDTMHWRRGTDARPESFDSKLGLLLVLRRDKKAEADAAAARTVAQENERLHGGNRLLRVLFVSDSRTEGKLGDNAWHAKVNWSDQLTDDQRTQIAKETGIAPDELPATTWLTTFEDRASPRPAKDEVYFDPAKDQTPIRPQVIRFHDTWIPIDMVLFGGIVLLIVIGAAVMMWKKRA